MHIPDVDFTRVVRSLVCDVEEALILFNPDIFSCGIDTVSDDVLARISPQCGVEHALADADAHVVSPVVAAWPPFGVTVQFADGLHGIVTVGGLVGYVYKRIATVCPRSHLFAVHRVDYEGQAVVQIHSQAIVDVIDVLERVLHLIGDRNVLVIIILPRCVGPVPHIEVQTFHPCVFSLLFPTCVRSDAGHHAVRLVKAFFRFWPESVEMLQPVPPVRYTAPPPVDMEEASVPVAVDEERHSALHTGGKVEYWISVFQTLVQGRIPVVHSLVDSVHESHSGVVAHVFHHGKGNGGEGCCRVIVKIGADGLCGISHEFRYGRNFRFG